MRSESSFPLFPNVSPVSRNITHNTPQGATLGAHGIVSRFPPYIGKRKKGNGLFSGADLKTSGQMMNVQKITSYEFKSNDLTEREAEQ